MSKDKKAPEEKFDEVPLFKDGIWRQRPKPKTGDKKSLQSHAIGTDRYRYFCYRTSGNDEKGKEGKEEEESSQQELAQYPLIYIEEPIEPVKVCIETQTDYREDETQTDPWEPPYIIKPGAKEPEILTLGYLKYGNGLPVSQEELEEIVRAREQREFETNLPPISSDENEIKKWRKMVAEQTIKEVNVAKMRIKEQFKYELVQRESALVQELKRRDERKQRFLEKVWARKKAELSDTSKKIREKYSRMLQSLDRQRELSSKKLCCKTEPFDEKEVSVGSNAIHRENKFSGGQGDNFYLDTAVGLVELERWLWEEQKIVMEPEIYLPKKDPHPTRLQNIMLQAEKELSESKAVTKPVSTRTSMKHTLEARKARPSTPSVQPILDEVIARHRAAGLIQKTLIARALQKNVIEIHSGYLNLVSEMRKTQAVMKHEQSKIEKAKKEKIQQYLEQKTSVDKKRIKEEVLSRFEGTVISDELNIRSKIVEREEQWQNIYDFESKAKDDRRRREAAEAGRRQKELQARQAIEQMVKKTQEQQKSVIRDMLNSVINEQK